MAVKAGWETCTRNHPYGQLVNYWAKADHMRKRLITPTPETVQPQGEGWLDLEREAAVEVTSEDENFPVECALVRRPHETERHSTSM